MYLLPNQNKVIYFFKKEWSTCFQDQIYGVHLMNILVSKQFSQLNTIPESIKPCVYVIYIIFL
jgi:hypothetical protein